MSCTLSLILNFIINRFLILIYFPKWYANLVYYDYSGNESSTIEINNKHYVELQLSEASPAHLLTTQTSLILNKHYVADAARIDQSSILNNFQLKDGSLLVSKMNYLNIGFYLCLLSDSVLSPRRIYLNMNQQASKNKLLNGNFLVSH
jgi:hypothetical protein